jgi:hypothetical protein
VVEAIVRVILQVDEPPHGIRRLPAAGLDLLEKGFGVVVILPA